MRDFKTSAFDLYEVNSREVTQTDLALAEAQAAVKGATPRLMAVPIAYREPVVTFDEAAATATRALAILADERSVDVEKIEQYGHHFMFYTFIMPIDAWRADGRIPGGLMCSVDKVDGGLWTDEENEAFGLLFH